MKSVQLKSLNLLLLALVLSFGYLFLSCSSDNNPDRISGFVKSGELPLEGFLVTVRSTGTVDGINILGEAITDSEGFFSIKFGAPTNPEAFLYLTADSGLAGSSNIEDSGYVRLATTIRNHPFDLEIAINERTTVATAYALAQFFTPDGINGVYPGPQNGAEIVQNLVKQTERLVIFWMMISTESHLPGLH